VSPFHFHRLYRGITGETPAATLRRLRLARAAEAKAQQQDGRQYSTGHCHGFLSSSADSAPQRWEHYKSYNIERARR
jgi:AraC family transcriptional regulator